MGTKVEIEIIFGRRLNEFYVFSRTLLSATMVMQSNSRALLAICLTNDFINQVLIWGLINI